MRPRERISCLFGFCSDFLTSLVTAIPYFSLGRVLVTPGHPRLLGVGKAPYFSVLYRDDLGKKGEEHGAVRWKLQDDEGNPLPIEFDKEGLLIKSGEE